MLKIKDNVDMNILEKYGFECHDEIVDENKRWKYYEKRLQIITEIDEEFPENERILDYDLGYDASEDNLDSLYEMIKDGIIEKIEEK